MTETYRAISRRKLLALMGASAVTTLAVGCGSSDEPNSGAPNQAPDAQFRHGVASGEPLPDAVVIWTRVTPFAEAVPGSGLGGPVDIVWEVATDAGFSTVLRQGRVTARAAQDHTIHVDVTGLQPDTSYWYRFKAGSRSSPIGRTRTAPAANSSPESIRFGMVTCTEWEFGFFAAYRHLAERDDIAAVLHMGDYIYEFGNNYGPVATPGQDLGRVHEPAHDIVSLADYRIRYGQYRSDPDLQAMHARHPVITIYDDHEIANDWWREGAENHSAATQGDFLARLAAGLQAWREWQPLRVFSVSDPLRAWRRMQFGDLIDMWMVDTRLYRDQQPANAIVGYGSVDPVVDSPTRTMLGAEQRDWLIEGLSSSSAQWKVMTNQIPFYPFVLGVALPSALANLLAPTQGTLPPLPAPLTVEDWNGYRFEQRTLINTMKTTDNVIVLTGDYHESFAAEVPERTGDYILDGNSVAVEFICPSVTSPGLSETLGRLGLDATGLPLSPTIDVLFKANLALANPWVKYHEGVSNGFAVFEVNRERTQFDYWFLADRTNPDSAANHAASWEVRAGAAKLFAVGQPLAT